MSIKNTLNSLVRKSKWFTEGELKDCQKFWDGIPYDLNVINLGSNSAKFAFDYTRKGVNAANLAMGPQCLLMDLNILKAYTDHLSKDAVVFIPICPFSSMAGYNYLIDPKYHTFLPKEFIPNYAKKTHAKMMNLKDNPINSYPLMRLFVDVREIIAGVFKNKSKTLGNLDSDADRWIKAWKSEFDIISFDDELSEENAKNRNDSAGILCSIYEYCLTKGLRPYVVMPPISKHLTDKMTHSMRQKYIYDYLELARIPSDHFLNYMELPIICEDDSMFTNAYFLNNKGSEAFTLHILSQLKLSELY